MQINTTRFGAVTIQPEDILTFPSGLLGFEEDRHWVLLADAENPTVGWLQSVSNEQAALPVVSPRRFSDDYRVRVSRSQLDPLQISEKDHAFVLAVVSKTEDELTINLKAPVIINLDRRLGRQVITNDEQPLQLALAKVSAPLRKSA